MLKKSVISVAMAALFWTSAGMVFSATAADTNAQKKRVISIEGEVYRTCNVDVSPKLELGNHRADWDGLTLRGAGSRSIDIKLEGCDRGTVINITSEGLYDSVVGNEYYLANSNEEYPDILVLLWLTFPGDSTEKYLNIARKVPVTYIAEEQGAHTLTLSGALRPAYTGGSPVGKFSSPLTLTFDFQ